MQLIDIIYIYTFIDIGIAPPKWMDLGVGNIYVQEGIYMSGFQKYRTYAGTPSFSRFAGMQTMDFRTSMTK